MRKLTKKQLRAIHTKGNFNSSGEGLIVKTNIGYERIYDDGYFHIGNRKIKPIKKDKKYFVNL